MPEPRSGKTPFPLRIVPPRFLDGAECSDGAEYSIAQRLSRHEHRPLVHVNADMRLILVQSPRNTPGDSVSYFAPQISWGRARPSRLSRRRGRPRPDHPHRIVPGAVRARCSCDCRPGGVMLTRGSPGHCSTVSRDFTQVELGRHVSNSFLLATACCLFRERARVHHPIDRHQESSLLGLRATP